MTNLQQIKLTDDQYIKVIKIAKEAYSMPQKYDSDIYLIDGEIVELKTFGNTYPQSYDICILSIKSQDTYLYQDMLQENMTVEAVEHCEANNWLATYETKSTNPADWEQFSINDDCDLEYTVVSTIERRHNAKIVIQN